jgi:hypothetical protein
MDDDDEMAPDRLEQSLNCALRSGAEFVYGKVAIETEPGRWRESGSDAWPTGRRPFRTIAVPHSASLYRSYLRGILYDSRSHRLGLPTDRHWIYRMARAGIHATFIPEVLTRVALRPESAIRRPASPPP